MGSEPFYKLKTYKVYGKCNFISATIDNEIA